jgi:hypothetical protein
MGLSGVHAQPVHIERGSSAFFDSLDSRIVSLQKQIPRLKQMRDVAYYNLQRELDLTLFARTCEEFIRDEDLDNARNLVEARLEKAAFRRDQYSIGYYNHYREDINKLIKQQRIHYQALFAKEKNFRKEFERFVEQGNQDSYRKTMKMVNLALKYAHENNLVATIKYLESYEAFTRALIFDHNSSFELAALTGSIKQFEKIFIPLIESDSLVKVKEAEMLLSHCLSYTNLAGSQVNAEYFARQGMQVASSLSVLLEKEGRERELEKYTDDAVRARFDTVNPRGVFKWHDQVIVIDEFIPKSSMEAVKKGEAILHADKMLSAYLMKNKLCMSSDDLKFGYAFVIPYKSTITNTSFMYNILSQKWQYIVCYSSIVDAGYTQRVSKYMPPLFFENENDMAQQPVRQE